MVTIDPETGETVASPSQPPFPEVPEEEVAEPEPERELTTEEAFKPARDIIGQQAAGTVDLGDAEYTPEKHLNELLQGIINLQSFFKEMTNHPDGRGIEYKLMLGWDIFTTSENDQWSTVDKYSNIDTTLLKDEFTSSKEYWDKIDWSKFWFYENERVQYGGITQWTQYNCEKEDWHQAGRPYNDNPNDRHPTYKAHRKFKSDVIEPMVEDMLK